jgi:hypothetical protein
VVADRSRSVADIAETRDSVSTLLRPGDALATFDSSAASVASIASFSHSNTRGELSAGLAAAMRAGAALAPRADSVELVIVSPIAAEEVDAATTHIRGAWPGRVRIVRVRATSDTDAAPRVQTAGAIIDANDAVIAGLSLSGMLGGTSGAAGATPATARLARAEPSTSDSAWARQGHVLVHWPASQRDVSWPRREQIDAIGGVATESGVLVGRFPRVWALSGAVVARWSDGEAAATERALGAGCIRDVAVLIDPAADITLHAPFRRFARALFAPCGGARSAALADSGTVARLAGAGPLAPSALLQDAESAPSSWTPWLLALGAALLLLELAVRRSEARAS